MIYRKPTPLPFRPNQHTHINTARVPGTKASKS